MEVVDIGHDAAGGGVVLQVVEHPVHLVHVPLGIVVFHGELIAVGLADRAGLVGPLVPDVGVQVVNVVGLLLPDPQQLVHRRLPVGAAQGQNGEFLLQVVPVDNAEFLDGMGGCAVLPSRTDLPVGVPDAVGENFTAVLNKAFVSIAHGGHSLYLHFSKYSKSDRERQAGGASGNAELFRNFQPFFAAFLQSGAEINE